MEHNKILHKLVPHVVDIYGDSLVSIILYGSVARGTQTEESDVDIAIMLRNSESTENKQQMTDLIVDFELEYDMVLSVIRIDYQSYKTWENTLPFYQNIKREGVILWQAA